MFYSQKVLLNSRLTQQGDEFGGHWHRNPGKGKTIIFIHGFLSDQASAWRKPSVAKSWVEVVLEDPELKEFGVYVIRYRTDKMSRHNDIGDTTKFVLGCIKSDKVLNDNQSLIFLCHSLGGIVARNLVVEFQLDFHGKVKKIGYFLIASPSLGSWYAYWLHFLLLGFLVDLPQARMLVRNNRILKELLTKFKKLVGAGAIPICGRELFEDKLPPLRFRILRWKPLNWILQRVFPLIVDKESATANFSEGTPIEGTDHFSISKVSSLDDSQHKVLRLFLREEFLTRMAPNGKLIGEPALDVKRRTLNPVEKEEIRLFKKSSIDSIKNTYIMKRELGALRTTVSWSVSYTDLIKRQYSKRTKDIDSLIDPGLRRQFIFLYGGAGSGKSAILQDLAVRLKNRDDMIPILIDLKPGIEHVRDAPAGRALLDVLLKRSIGLCNLDLFSNLLAGATPIVLLDGFNELDKNAQRLVADLFYDLVFNHTHLSVIVSNRLYTSDEWQPTHFVIVDRLDEEVIRKKLREKLGNDDLYSSGSPGLQSVLSIPFFLRLAVGMKYSGAGSRSRMLDEFFGQSVSLTPAEYFSASSAAYSAYENYVQYQEDQNFLTKHINTDKLMNSGVINEKGKFDHQLFHDYLASRHLASQSELWNHKAFDVVSLQGNSFDVLTLIAEQVEEPDSDKYVKAVYDWNYWAAIVCIIDNVSSPDSPKFSQDIVLSMLSILAEKTTDNFIETSQEAWGKLSSYPGPESSYFRSDMTIEELREVVSQLQGDNDWFIRWKEIFVTDPTHIPGKDLLLSITDKDSVIGWTTSNILKRVQMTNENWDQLRLMYQALLNTESHSFRWRIVHTVGGSQFEPTNIKFLSSAIEKDAYPWVGYGALRSLLEIASRSNKNQRQHIFQEVGRLLAVGSIKSLTSRALGKALFVRVNVDGWQEDIQELVSKFQKQFGPNLKTDPGRFWAIINNRLESMAKQREIHPIPYVGVPDLTKAD